MKITAPQGWSAILVAAVVTTIMTGASLQVTPTIKADNPPDPTPAPIIKDIELAGPDTVVPGKSAIIKIPKDVAGTNYSWLVQPKTVNWINGENQKEVFAILLDLDNGQYFISFANPTSHGVKTLTAGDLPAPPDPKPGPVNPDLPAGPLGLIKSSYEWTSVVDAKFIAQAKPLASSFRATAAQIAAGTLTKPADILAASKTSNNTALGSPDAINAWKPWAVKLQEALTKLNTDKKLNTSEDYKEAFNEIAQGLEAVKTS